MRERERHSRDDIEEDPRGRSRRVREREEEGGLAQEQELAPQSALARWRTTPPLHYVKAADLLNESGNKSQGSHTRRKIGRVSQLMLETYFGKGLLAAFSYLLPSSVASGISACGQSIRL